jgi:translation initiation factor 1
VRATEPAERTRVRRDREAPYARLPDDGVVRILRERRRGGTMSVVAGLDPREVEDVGKALKRHCGTGGTAKNGVVEIQGDHRDRIAAWFAAQGRKVKLAGG